VALGGAGVVVAAVVAAARTREAPAQGVQVPAALDRAALVQVAPARVDLVLVAPGREDPDPATVTEIRTSTPSRVCISIFRPRESSSSPPRKMIRT